MNNFAHLSARVLNTLTGGEVAGCFDNARTLRQPADDADNKAQKSEVRTTDQGSK